MNLDVHVRAKSFTACLPPFQQPQLWKSRQTFMFLEHEIVQSDGVVTFEHILQASLPKSQL